LEKLAEKLRNRVFHNWKEREAIARNWHRILKQLKNEHGLKNKGDVYRILQKAGSADDAGKKSEYYEIPNRLDAKNDKDDIRRRAQKLIKNGKKWLLLAERAAEISGKGPYDWLPQLLDGTDLRSGDTERSEDTPDAANALYDLLSAACRRIADETGLEQFFRDWDRAWVGYRQDNDSFFVDPMYLGSGDKTKYLEGPPDLPDFISQHLLIWSDYQFYKQTEEMLTRSQPWPNILKGQLFGIRFFLGSLDGEFTAFALDDGCRKIKDFQVKVTFYQELRLAIGKNSISDEISPILELVDCLFVWAPELGKGINFQPVKADWCWDGWLDNCDSWEQEEAIEAGYSASGQPWEMEPLHGLAIVENAQVEGRLDLRIEPARARAFVAFLRSVDKSDESGNYSIFQSSSCLLTPDNIRQKLFYSYGSESGLPEPVQDEEFRRHIPIWGVGSVEPTLSELGRASFLESMLLEGRASGTLYDRLLSSTKTKIERFYTEFRKVRDRVELRHKDALQDFVSNGREPQSP